RHQGGAAAVSLRALPRGAAGAARFATRARGLAEARLRAHRRGTGGPGPCPVRRATLADPRPGPVRAYAARSAPAGHRRAPPPRLRPARVDPAPPPRPHRPRGPRGGDPLRRVSDLVRRAREDAVRGRAAVPDHAAGAAGATRRARPHPPRLPRLRGTPMRFLPPLAVVLALAADVAPARAADRAAAAASPALQMQHRTLAASHGRVEAESGQLMVPENRAVATSRRIPIRFLWLRSTAAKPKAPLFYLAGGPGDRGVAERREWIDVWAPLLGVCDVVLIDQRGVGDRDLTWQWDGPPPLAFFLDADSARRHEAELSRRGLAAIRARGVDLAGYTTAASAADVDELRAALHLDKVSLLAFSYGTHLACAYLRAYGPHVENAVCLGLEGPDQTYKLPWAMDTQFRKVALLAAADPQIAGQVPDLVALYDRVAAKLAKQPVVVDVAGPAGDTLRVPVGPFGLRLILRFDIGDATDLPVFPRLLWSIDQGDPSVLAWFVRKRASVTLGFAGMNHAMDAASGATRGR